MQLGFKHKKILKTPLFISWNRSILHSLNLILQRIKQEEKKERKKKMISFSSYKEGKALPFFNLNHFFSVFRQIGILISWFSGISEVGRVESTNWLLFFRFISFCFLFANSSSLLSIFPSLRVFSPGAFSYLLLIAYRFVNIFLSLKKKRTFKTHFLLKFLFLDF